MKNELIPFSPDTSLSSSGIIALSVKDFDGINISGQTDIIKNTLQGHNVLAKLKLGSSTHSMIVLGAHVDHLGHGELSGSRARQNETGNIHPGADDNASGVASMIEVARRLSYLKTKSLLHGNRDILLNG